MRTLKISGGLVVAAFVWVGLLSLLAGGGGGSQSVSVPSTDGSQATIKLIDKAKFYAAQSGEISVRMDILGADKKPILGLSPQKFRVTEEGIEVPVKALNGPGTQPINVMLVIDISGSMRAGNRIGAARDAALVAVDALQVDRDRLGLIVFDDRFDVLQPLSNLTSRAKDDCRQSIQRLQPRGGTTIGPPTVEALRLFEQAAPNGLKLLLVMTDGEDSELQSHIERIAKASDAQGVPVYSIVFGDRNVRAEGVLKELATKCQGEYYFAPSGDELARIYRSRVEEASNEFLVVYDSPYPEADGLPRRLQIEVETGLGTLSAGDGYHIGPLITGGRRSAPKIAGASGKTADTSSTGSQVLKVGLLLSLLAVLVAGLAAPEFLPKFRTSLSAAGETLAGAVPGTTGAPPAAAAAPMPAAPRATASMPAPPMPPAPGAGSPRPVAASPASPPVMPPAVGRATQPPPPVVKPATASGTAAAPVVAPPPLPPRVTPTLPQPMPPPMKTAGPAPLATPPAPAPARPPVPAVAPRTVLPPPAVQRVSPIAPPPPPPGSGRPGS